MKTCFKCGIVKPLSEYYKHKQMKDGHLNKCKQCTKKDSTDHRNINLEKVKEYDKARSMLPHRVEARAEYAQTDAGKAAHYRGVKKYREKFPDRAQARHKVSNAMRDGKLIRPSTCQRCGDECKPHAHHWSYLEENWLNVFWLCIHCHLDIHNEN